MTHPGIGALTGLALVHIYAPDLNPDERVWQHLKRVEFRNLGCDDLVHRSSEVKLAVNRMRRKPPFIQPFFERAGLEL